MFRHLATCITVFALALVGCQPQERTDGRVSVVAAFYPLAEAAERVGGEHVTVANLTPAGAEPHDLEMTSRQVDAVLDADVVLYLGGGFQPALEDVASRTDGREVDVLDSRDEEDPHVWLDPTRMARIVERVQDTYVEVDAAHAASYRANAAAYRSELEKLDVEFGRGLEICERRTIVTAHAAFGHLARRYRLTQEPIAGLSPESEPDPEQLADLTDKVRAEGITTIFYETLTSPAVADALAREAGVQTAVLHPLEGLTEKEVSGGADYVSVMRTNLAALRKALSCQ